MLLGADPIGVLDCAAEVEHCKHGEDHHHTLQQQGELKLFPDPEGKTNGKILQSQFIYNDDLAERRAQSENRQQMKITYSILFYSSMISISFRCESRMNHNE